MSLFHIIDEIRACYIAGIWYPCLATTLLLPDVCGAIDGKVSKSSDRWIKWYDDNVAGHYQPSSAHQLDGQVFYKFRNAMVHENTGFAKKAFGFDRIAFQVKDDANGNVLTFASGDWDGSGEVPLILNLHEFVNEVTSAAGRWEADLRTNGTAEQLERLARLITLHPSGLTPWVSGLPVIG